MTQYILLSVRFLDDSYHGLTDNGEKSEWPPSPFRVFQALVAGNARGKRLPDAMRSAFMWLESLAPPRIIAPQAEAGRVLLTYVLNNDSDFNINARAPKPIRPTLLNGDRLVQYGWSFDPLQPDARKHAETILGAARHINALGWGIDLAIGRGEVVEHLPLVADSRVEYRPINSVFAGVDLRVPRRDSLISLERIYADFLRRYETPGVTRHESSSAIYEPCRYAVGLTRPWVAFRLVNTDGDAVSIRHSLIKPLVAMIRNVANRPQVVATLGQDLIDREIKGHPKESTANRISIVPLPTLRPGPTDGRIRRLMLAQSFESDGQLCYRLGQLFDGEKLQPIEGEDRFPEIFLERIDRSDKVLPFYSCISPVWASVTPVLLPGYDDRKNHQGSHLKRLARAEQLVHKALHQAGITTPRRVELSRAPYWAGSLHSQAYQPRERLVHYPRWHVRLTFARPCTGPLVIGAGRHCGFGLMAGGDAMGAAGSGSFAPA